jgi:quercetin dioxygenase-like cupin family protein
MIEPMPRPNWEPLPRPGTVGVTGRVLLKRAGIAVANLRFSPNATIDEHKAPCDIDVICIEGEGFVSVGDLSSPFCAGESIVWPSGINHRLWTKGAEMETLMIERIGWPR